MKWSLLCFATILFAVKADFGDFVDPTFDCPAMTTCKQVCVSDVSECPADMLCDINQTLCADGSCADNEFECEGAESPCAFECASVACAKIVNDDLDSCALRFGQFWEDEAACGEEEYAENVTLYTFREPAFVFFYCWICIVTFIILGWCAYNQRFSPVDGSTKTLQVQSVSSAFQKSTKQLEEEKGSHGWQTGYKVHPVGTLVYALALLTLFGIQGLLGWLTIQYYLQQEAILHLNGRFEDEQQCLKAFIIAWLVGFAWSFSLKFPFSIRSICFRRCAIEEATHVAICLERKAEDNEVTFQEGHINAIRAYFSIIREWVWAFFTFLFSDMNAFGSPRKGDGVFVISPVQTALNGGEVTEKFFTFMFRRYNLKNDSYVPGTWNVGDTIEEILTHHQELGLTDEQVTERTNVVGQNQIEMRKPTFLMCFYRELAKPFYTYQAFMVWSWFPFWYFYMAIVWTFVIMTGALSVTFFQYRNEANLYRITKQKGNVQVIRNGNKTSVPFEALVPGDLVQVTPGMAFADMLLVDSEVTLVDESAITGEATPVGKTPMDPSLGKQQYSRLSHKRCTIMAGTTILEADESSRAIVLSTASFTARGELLREIFSFKRHQFKFDVEVPIVITILFFYAIFGFAITFYFIGEQFIYGWFYGIYVVGTILPPLLPTVFTVSVGISDDRLSRKNITCTNSESILVAGKVTRAFFDKTGTLTQQGLNFHSTRTKKGWKDSENTSKVIDDATMALGMGVCHSLVPSKQSSDLLGNPVDRTMFEASGSKIEAKVNKNLVITDANGQKVEVVKHFDFDHHRMTQSVVIKKEGGELVAFVKGSDESIKKHSEKGTLPSDFDSYSDECARNGYYQISMATKSLGSGTDLSNLSRDQVESGLTFLGVVNFKNEIRPETAGVIRHLEEGEVEAIMVTGDSVLTGLCIAKEAGILKPDSKVVIGKVGDDDRVSWATEAGEAATIPKTADGCIAENLQIAISGPAWNVLAMDNPEEAAKLVPFVRVYGRCTPYDKVLVVSTFVKLGYITLMCGDGGNDCGALKTAHVGISLSDAEASIVAPFTSLDKSIESVVEVLLEGRCSLASALASYKYMIMYGQIETLNQIMNAHFLITFSEFCWVFMDGIWTITLAFTLPLARPALKLSPSRPTASLLGLQTISSTLGVLGLNFLFTVIALFYLFSQDWYQCRKWEDTDVSNLLVIGDNYETETIFLITGFQYIISAIAFNFSYEFRKGYLYNFWFVAISTGYVIIHLYITMNPGELSCLWRVNCVNENVQPSVTFEPVPIQNDFNTTVMPEDYRRGLVGIMLGNLVAICAWDCLIVNGTRRYYGKQRREEEAQNKAKLIANHADA